MLEHGIVKVFFGARSKNQGRYGFIRLIDREGNFTGQEVFFHLNNAMTPIGIHFAGCNVSVGWSEKATLADLGREPREGDLVVVEIPPLSAHKGPGLRKAFSWTYLSLWAAEELTAQTNIIHIRPNPNPEPDPLGYDWRDGQLLRVMHQYGDNTDRQW